VGDEDERAAIAVDGEDGIAFVERVRRRGNVMY